MAMPQRDETIEEIKRLDALLEYAVMHDDEAEAARLRARQHRIHGIIHSHRRPQAESRCNRRARRGEEDDRVENH